MIADNKIISLSGSDIWRTHKVLSNYHAPYSKYLESSYYPESEYYSGTLSGQTAELGTFQQDLQCLCQS
jgi:hypothetical protein